MWNKPKIGEDIWFQIPFDSLSFLRLSAFLSRQPLNRAHLKLWFFQFSFFKRINSCANIFTMNNVKTKRIWAVWIILKLQCEWTKILFMMIMILFWYLAWCLHLAVKNGFILSFTMNNNCTAETVGIKHYHQASWKCIFFHFRVSMVIQTKEKRKWRWHCCENE